METEGKTPEAATAESAEPAKAPEVTVEQLQAMLKERDEEVVNLKSTVSGKDKALARALKQAGDLTGVEQRLAQHIDDRIGRLAKRVLSDDDVSGITPPVPLPPGDAVGFGTYLDEKFEDEGLDINNPPDVVLKGLNEANVLWAKGTPEDRKSATKLVKKAITDYKKSLDTQKKEIADAEVKERQTKANALKNVQVGSQGASTGYENDDKFMTAFSEGKLNSPADFKRAMELQMKLQNGG